MVVGQFVVVTDCVGCGGIEDYVGCVNCVNWGLNWKMQYVVPNHSQLDQNRKHENLKRKQWGWDNREWPDGYRGNSSRLE